MLFKMLRLDGKVFQDYIFICECERVEANEGPLDAI